MSDGPRRDALHEFHWLPTRHGALLKTLPVHEPNDLYDTTFRLFTLQSPFSMGKTAHAIGMKADELNKIRGSKVTMIFQDPLTALTPHIRIGDQISEPLREHLGMSDSAARAAGPSAPGPRPVRPRLRSARSLG